MSSIKISTHVSTKIYTNYRITGRPTADLQSAKDVSGSDLEQRSTSEHSSNGKGKNQAR